MGYTYISGGNFFAVKYTTISIGEAISGLSHPFGTGTRGLLNWENYQHFGKLSNTAHLLNEEQNSYFLLNL